LQVKISCDSENEKLFELFDHFETVRKSDSSFLAFEEGKTGKNLKLEMVRLSGAA
jgi:hypothetical protein